MTHTIDSSGDAATSSGARFQRFAIPSLFILLGMVYASWAARIPSIRDGLHLEAATLSVVLLCGGIGSVLSFPLAAWLNAHYGARRSAWYGGIGLLIALPCTGLAPNLPLLMLAMAMVGVGSGCFDVAINALGAAAEKRAGRSQT